MANTWPTHACTCAFLFRALPFLHGVRIQSPKHKTRRHDAGRRRHRRHRQTHARTHGRKPCSSACRAGCGTWTCPETSWCSTPCCPRPSMRSGTKSFSRRRWTCWWRCAHAFCCAVRVMRLFLFVRERERETTKDEWDVDRGFRMSWNGCGGGRRGTAVRFGCFLFKSLGGYLRRERSFSKGFRRPGYAHLDVRDVKHETHTPPPALTRKRTRRDCSPCPSPPQDGRPFTGRADVAGERPNAHTAGPRPPAIVVPEQACHHPRFSRVRSNKHVHGFLRPYLPSFPPCRTCLARVAFARSCASTRLATSRSCSSWCPRPCRWRFVHPASAPRSCAAELNKIHVFIFRLDSLAHVRMRRPRPERPRPSGPPRT